MTARPDVRSELELASSATMGFSEEEKIEVKMERAETNE
jgi:hypothetical protein